VPDFSFLMIDEQRFSKESLLALDSIMARVFLVEKATMDDMARIGGAFQDIYKKEIKPELKRILEIWFLRKIEMAGLETEGLDLDEGEVAEVLETNIRRDRARLRKEGRTEEKYEIARKLGAIGEDIGKIAMVTGLPEKEIEALLKASKSGE
jgi:hypothetical protein